MANSSTNGRVNGHTNGYVNGHTTGHTTDPKPVHLELAHSLSALASPASTCFTSYESKAWMPKSSKPGTVSVASGIGATIPERESIPSTLRMRLTFPRSTVPGRGPRSIPADRSSRIISNISTTLSTLARILFTAPGLSRPRLMSLLTSGRSKRIMETPLHRASSSAASASRPNAIYPTGLVLKMTSRARSFTQTSGPPKAST